MAPGFRASSVFLAGSLGFFALSFVGMGLAPWTTLERVVTRIGVDPYADPQIRRGREVYIREGCWHCHTQFVRPIANEESRYGPVSLAHESAHDVPQLYGTRRIGPDLAREAGRRTDDWHLAHLFNPRTTVPASIMPSYPWLFAADAAGRPRPTADGAALVAYLQQLGHLRADDVRALVHPRVDMIEGAPASTPEYDRRGAALFRRHCVGCHGAAGDGRAPAAPFLDPPATDLTAVRMLPQEAYRILAGGIEGSAMPSWRELSHYDLWALAHHTVRLWRADAGGAPPATAERLAAGRSAFAAYCAACHGGGGRGDGPAAPALRPRPPDFSRFSPSPGYAYRIITGGLGAAMPPWGHLDEETRWNLALFVHRLWAGDAAAPAVADAPGGRR